MLGSNHAGRNSIKVGKTSTMKNNLLPKQYLKRDGLVTSIQPNIVIYAFFNFNCQ